MKAQSADTATQDQMTHLPVWLPQCWRVRQLQILGAKVLTDLSGLPSSLQVLELTGCYELPDFSQLLACSNLWELSLGSFQDFTAPIIGCHTAGSSQLQQLHSLSLSSSASADLMPFACHETRVQCTVDADGRSGVAPAHHAHEL